MKVHVSEILRKLGVRSRTEAIIALSKLDFGKHDHAPVTAPPTDRAGSNHSRAPDCSAASRNDSSERISAGLIGFFSNSWPNADTSEAALAE